MTVIHVVANVQKINLGVWKAAIVGKDVLTEKGVRTILTVCDPTDADGFAPPEQLEVFFLKKGDEVESLLNRIEQIGANRSNTVVASHGSWLKPTKIGAAMSRKGFPWIYVPQGMLEPWSMQQKKIIKSVYFTLIERRLIKTAAAVRAVSRPEHANLTRLLARPVSLVPNGVSIPPASTKSNGAPVFLFMARLHEKKGVLPLVQAWHAVMKDKNAKLIVAGPDEGELEKISPYLRDNVSYVGPVYGTEKANLLNSCHYYILPSHSEGFPTSVLEGMSYGAIPLISKGCNFPEVFEQKLGYNVEPDVRQIADQLETLSSRPFDTALSLRNRVFIEENYSEAVVGQKLFELYSSVIGNN
jgi:glycosyltransferase involved in cell wall biosynthesis